MQAAEAKGAELHEQESVISWEEDLSTGGLRIVTDKGEYTADRLVMTAGSWMGELVKPLRVRHQPHLHSMHQANLSSLRK